MDAYKHKQVDCQPGLLCITPAKSPPHLSSIPTIYNSDSFTKVLARLTSNSTRLDNTESSRTHISSTQTQHKDTLTFTFRQHSDLSTSKLASPVKIPLKSSSDKIAPIFFQNKSTSRSQAVSDTKWNGADMKQASTIYSQASLSKFSKFSTPFMSGQKTTQNSQGSAGLIPNTLKQTKIGNSGKLMLSSQNPPAVSSQSTSSTGSHKKLPKPPHETCLSQYISKTSTPLKDLRKMSLEELSELEVHLFQVEEVAACLVYGDGSSQLRLHTVKGKAVGGALQQTSGLCIAYPTRNQCSRAPTLNYVLLPLDKTDDHLFNWCKNQLRNILRGARVIAYGGQRLASSVMSCFDLLDCSSEWLQWNILDMHVGAWLLDPDHPPESFVHMLSQCGIQSPKTDGKLESQTQMCADLSQLGPGMVQIYQKLHKENLWVLFEKVEMKLIPILAAMEVGGIQVDSSKLLKYAELLKTKISKVEELAYKAVGHKFLINSTAQLRQILFEELHLDNLCSKQLSKTQVYKQKSTSEAVLFDSHNLTEQLTQLEGFHPLPRLVLEYRQLCKINATYISGVLPYISEDVLKTTWQQTGTATGRLVSSNPNIQAFPKQSINLGVVKESFIVGKEPEEVTIDIREAVKSRLKCTFIAADFKSIELRLVAHFSEDNLLISILNSKRTPDVFVHLTSEWLGVDVSKVTQAHRERTKRVVYAVVYGVGKERLAAILDVQPSYAKDLTSSFLTKFPGVQKFITNTIEECRGKGYLETICGRRRWFPHINSANLQVRLHSERQAVNFLVQGSAADVCKCGMVDVCRILARDHPKSRLLLQIHDELMFEVPDSDVKAVASMLKVALETLSLTLDFSLKVPLEVRLTGGKTWASLTDLDL